MKITVLWNVTPCRLDPSFLGQIIVTGFSWHNTEYSVSTKLGYSLTKWAIMNYLKRLSAQNRTFFSVTCIPADRVGVGPHFSAFKGTDRFSQKLVGKLYHWRLLSHHTFQLPTVGNTNMADMLTCEAGANIFFRHSSQWQLMNHWS
jgi:hypothetical protein